MVEEILVKEALTAGMIEVGAALTRGLRQRMTVTNSLWLYLPDKNLWRLMIASPRVKAEGPRVVYEEVQRSLNNLTPAQRQILDLTGITVVEDDHPIASLLRKVARPGDITTGVRFYRSAINGQYIDDAYIYHTSPDDSATTREQPKKTNRPRSERHSPSPAR